MAFILQKEAGRIGLTFSFGPPPPLEEWTHDRLSPVDLYNLRLLGEKISLQEGFDELLKEYLMRGLVERVLILTPPSLVS
jgi:hypothetical protein